MLGIITITNGTDNFGNLLQNYAVQQILLDLGYESETIRNISFKEYRRFGLYFLPKFATGIYKGVKSMKFMHFARKYIKYSKAIVTSKNKNLNALRDQYDKFICGSDQVWNPDYRGNQNWEFNLMQFARPEQKVAYAASFGLSKIPEQYNHLFKESLKDYHSISVREIDAANYVRALTNQKCTVVIDPTMMFEADKWEKLATPVRTLQGKKFVLKYILGNDTVEIGECLQKVVDDNVVVVKLSNPNSSYYASGPDEFLWLIQHAEFVFTDSFHATAFSILFHTPFYVFEKRDEYGGTFSRISTLLSQFNLDERVYTGASETVSDKMDFTGADEKLAYERNRAFDFLRQSLA